MMHIWTQPAPGYDGPDDWMIAQYPQFRDARAVEETLALAREEGAVRMDYTSLVDGISFNEIGAKVHWKQETLMSYLDSMQGTWDVAIQTANGQMESIEAATE